MTKGMTKRDYLRLRAQIEERYRGDLAALDRVWALAGGGKEDGELAVGTSPVEEFVEGKPRRGSVDKLVRWAIEELSGEFGVQEVQGYLSSKHPEQGRLIPRASISSALVRMSEQGLIAVVEKGLGRRPSVYIKAPAPAEHPELDDDDIPF